MGSAFELEQIRQAMVSVAGVISVGDIHLWPISQDDAKSDLALTAGLACRLEIVDFESWFSLRGQLAQRLLALGVTELVLEPLVSNQNQTPVPAKEDLGLAMALRYEQQWQAERQALAESLSTQLTDHALTIRTLASTIETRLAQEVSSGGASASLSNIASLLVGSANALFDSLRATLTSIRTSDPDKAGLVQATKSVIADAQLAEPRRRIELFLQPDDASFGVGNEAIEAVAFKLVQAGLAASLDDAVVKTTVVSLRSTVGVLTVHVSDDGQAPGTKFRPLLDTLNLSLRSDVEDLGGIFNLGQGDSGGFELWVTLPWPGG
jgi:glucose-6-phosphate-specific signal transduction histidine kinase